MLDIWSWSATGWRRGGHRAAAAARRERPLLSGRHRPVGEAPPRRAQARRAPLRSDGGEGRSRGPEAGPPFAEALRGPGISVIAEVKRHSPSKGPIRPDLDSATLVWAYEAGGARRSPCSPRRATSTGALSDLRTAAGATALPLLRKDFIGDPYQVYEARAFGASAVLLIAGLLLDERPAGSGSSGPGPRAWTYCWRCTTRGRWSARSRGGRHRRHQQSRPAHVRGVARDELSAWRAWCRPGRILVAESGIRDRADVERLAAAGVDAVLVGESLLRQGEAGAAVAASRQASLRRGAAVWRSRHERGGRMSVDGHTIRVLTPVGLADVTQEALPSALLEGLRGSEGPVTWVHAESNPRRDSGPGRHGS